MSLFIQMIYLASGLSLVYIFLLYRSNPLRRLPGTTVTVSFTLGMIAVIPVALLHRFLPLTGGGAAFSSFVNAGLVEEGVKFGIMGLTIWRFRFPDLAEPIDLAIYFGILGVGFGVYEDFSYLLNGVYLGWNGGTVMKSRHILQDLILARSFPGHILFDSLAGFLLGKARFLSPGRERIVWITGGFLFAVALHGMFDLIATVGGTIPLLTYIVLLIGLFLHLRRWAISHSPFAALIRLITSGKEKWTFSQPPVDYLFAEGFTWPGKGSRGMFELFPLTLSLLILYPLLVAVIYLVERVVLWGFKG